jgi:hypothetical protein
MKKKSHFLLSPFDVKHYLVNNYLRIGSDSSCVMFTYPSVYMTIIWMFNHLNAWPQYNKMLCLVNPISSHCRRKWAFSCGGGSRLRRLEHPLLILRSLSRWTVLKCQSVLLRSHVNSVVIKLPKLFKSYLENNFTWCVFFTIYSLPAFVVLISSEIVCRWGWQVTGLLPMQVNGAFHGIEKTRVIKAYNIAFGVDAPSPVRQACYSIAVRCLKT